ncbi:hypothetical protein BB560_000507 [Smittium megazygosporum]|uniref:Peroxisomal ATPase PEX6 n=1 Tax=Smittium megazygosporum TaxID=133381 RepID=A0A2T9ZK53_9FUNG|nr:hypothetical protein BB560_000507 [Smittium megazygosporum]
MARGYLGYTSPIFRQTISVAVQPVLQSSLGNVYPQSTQDAIYVPETLYSTILSKAQDLNAIYKYNVYAKISFSFPFVPSSATLVSHGARNTTSSVLSKVLPKHWLFDSKNSSLLDEDTCVASGSLWSSMLQHQIQNLIELENLVFGYAVFPNCTIELVYPLPLERVVLGIKPEDFEYVSSIKDDLLQSLPSIVDIFGQQSVINTAITPGNSIVKINSWDLSLYLVDTFPFPCGTWDPSFTEIVLVPLEGRYSYLLEDLSPKQDQDFLSNTTKSLPFDSEPDSSILLDFLEDSVFLNHYKNICKNFDIPSSFDPLGSCAFMSVDSLVQYGLADNDLVLIKPVLPLSQSAIYSSTKPQAFSKTSSSLNSTQKNPLSFSTGRIVRVFAFDELSCPTNNTLYLSKHLFTNSLIEISDSLSISLSELTFQSLPINVKIFSFDSSKQIISGSLTSEQLSSSIISLASPIESTSPSHAGNNSAPSSISENLEFNRETVFPVATDLALARVSSPSSINRDYEKLASEKLKLWLAGPHHRVLQLGDLIAIKITFIESIAKNAVSNHVLAEIRSSSESFLSPTNDSSKASSTQLVPYGAKGLSPPEIEQKALEISSVSNLGNVFQRSNIDNSEWICFKVMSLSSSSNPLNFSDLNISAPGTYSSVNGDVTDFCAEYENIDQFISIGKYGYSVDPSTTRISINGVCNSLLPYAIFDSTYSPNQSKSPNFPKNFAKPYQSIQNKLFKLLKASINSTIINSPWTLSIAVCGSRGAGKMHLLQSTAKKLGIHIYKVKISDLISDLGRNSSNTIQNLFKTYLDHCIQLVPCIVVFDKLDLLVSHFRSHNGETANEEILKLSKQLKTIFFEYSAKAKEVHRKASNVSKKLAPSKPGDTTRKEYIFANRTKPHPFPLVIAATYAVSLGERSSLDQDLLSSFRTVFELNTPDESDRLALLQSILLSNKILPLSTTPTSLSFPTVEFEDNESESEKRILSPSSLSWGIGKNVDLSWISKQTASFLASDFVKMLNNSKAEAWRRIKNRLLEFKDTNDNSIINKPSSLLIMRTLWSEGVVLSEEDFKSSLANLRSSMSDQLGVPKIPNVKWEDVGGLEVAKKDILDTIKLPLESPDLVASGIHIRSGLLFYGPPGTGKTLLAKAIATECNLNFFSVKGPELLNMYIGESEANVRRVFQKAREASPCVVFFDELDSLAPKRGQFGDSGGVMDRVVSQLLAELDGMSSAPSQSSSKPSKSESGSSSAKGDLGSESTPATPLMFVIGATNRPDLLDSALMRPGRFDKLVYLGVSSNHGQQLKILEALTRKLQLSPSLNLSEIAEQCTLNLTGADLYALCADAQLKATLRSVENVDRAVEEYNRLYEQQQNNIKQSENTDRQQTLSDITQGINFEDKSVSNIEAGHDNNAVQKEYLQPSVKHPYPMTPSYFLDYLAPEDLKKVVIEKQDFEKALEELIPSVSFGDLERYKNLQNTL